MRRDSECGYCGSMYIGEAGLRRHQQAVHEAEVSVEVPCNWCGTSLDAYEWESDDRHYCSATCRNAWSSYLQSGERHVGYEHGNTRSKAFDYTATAIRRRDGRCLSCGVVDGASDGRNLSVHHIVPESDCENRPHKPTNLISLCGTCHGRLEGVKPKRQLEICGIGSRSELELSGEVKNWLETMLKRSNPVERAPAPRIGMFSEAERVLSDR